MSDASLLTEAGAQVSDHRLDELIEEHTGYGADLPTGRVHSTFRMGELESVLREVRALRSALTAGAKPPEFNKATDRALAAFKERFGVMPHSIADQQWCNGYARALQHVRTQSVPEPFGQGESK